jgi:hypothetical protein
MKPPALELAKIEDHHDDATVQLGVALPSPQLTAVETRPIVERAPTLWRAWLGLHLHVDLLTVR